MTAADITLTAAEWLAKVKKSRGRCHYCGQKVAKLTIDHVYPLSKGGRHTSENVVPSCQGCNSRKHDKVVSLF
jgi:5-methylcytosine-specific restriction endonuclease McrA